MHIYRRRVVSADRERERENMSVCVCLSDCPRGQSIVSVGSLPHPRRGREPRPGAKGFKAFHQLRFPGSK